MAWLQRCASLALVLASLGVMAASGADESRRYVKGGLVVEFSASKVEHGSAAPDKGLAEDELAELRFRISEEATGKPVRGLSPGAWLDMGEIIQGAPGAEQKSCKDKIALYLRGIVGMRPMVDLNSYFVVVLNQEPSLSIIDPTVSMAGRTSTLARVVLARPGADIATSRDEKRVFVSMPAAAQVAVVDTDTWKVAANVPAGPGATRLAVQPDGRYVWVGLNAEGDRAGGVSVIDTETLKPLATIETGRGHHEIALSDDSRWAFVTNRSDGTVSVIDVRTLQLAHTLKAGGQPISLAYSKLAKTLFVADAQGGVVHVIRPGDFETVGRIAVKPGLGPMRFTEDGRWALLLNTSDDRVLVLDPSSNTIVHDMAVQAQPYQLAFTRAFAYVRALGSERVSMIDLSTLGAGKTPRVLSFAAGAVPPKAAGDLVIADSMAPAVGDAGVLVVNPADNTTYFYMEGMNASSSNYQAYGARARAVTVVDRSLQEVEPGVYASRLKMPAAGRFDVAFSLDSPQLLHCFSTTAAANPAQAEARKGVKVEYLLASRQVESGGKLQLRFRVFDGATREPKTGLKDVLVKSVLAPGRQLATVPARELGDGVYQAEVAVRQPGAYYVYVGSQTLGKGFLDLPFVSLVATGRPPVGTNVQ
ncbi:MAG: cytochrome D1 [Aquincola sp.]|nr:cytochrome D1 [Aquincola sp.]